MIPVVCGIYLIRNNTAWKQYVGSSINIHDRLVTHKWALRANRHVNTILQNAWNKYGESDFSFIVAEECPQDVLKEHEQSHIDSGMFEYNIASFVDTSMRGRHHSEETKQKISQSLMGHPVSAESARKTADANRGRVSPNRGKPLSEEHKHKLRMAKLGKPGNSRGTHRSEESCRRNGELKKGNKYRLGSHASEEAKLKMRMAKLGKPSVRGTGWHPTEETKLKMRESWARRKARSRSKNLQLSLEI